MRLDIFVRHTFGNLTVLGFEQVQGKKQKHWYARCRCVCGAEKPVLWNNIMRGMSTSCGCLSRVTSEATRKANDQKWFTTRGEEVYTYYEDNPHLSMREIGEIFGITRQRVQQTVAMYGPSHEGIAELYAARKQLVAQYLEERKQLLIEVERLRSSENTISEAGGTPCSTTAN